MIGSFRRVYGETVTLLVVLAFGLGAVYASLWMLGLKESAPTVGEYGTLATAALFAFQLWREHQRKVEEEEAAKSQVSTIAFALRRQIQSWTTGTGSMSELLVWAKNRPGRWAGVTAAEQRFEQLSALIPKLSREDVIAVHRATALFYEAVDWLNEYDEPTARYDSEDRPIYFASTGFQALVIHLTKRLIDPGMRTAEEEFAKAFKGLSDAFVHEVE